MKKYINKLFVLVMVVAAIGCSDDYLTTQPTHAYSPASALSSPENMLVALNGMHREMYGQSELNETYNAGECYIMPMMEYGAGDFIRPIPGVGWFATTCKWTSHTDANSGNNDWVWYQYYHLIGSANNIINAAEGMVETDLLKEVLGQAHAYRAFLYHRLVCLFAKNPQYTDETTELGVPIMLKTEAPYQGQPRETVAKVYEQCEADIQKAITYLTGLGTRSSKTHITAKIANGIAARIALTKGDFVSAATYAKVARTGFSLMSEEEYKSGFNSYKNGEWMWAAEVVADQTNYYRSWFYYVGMNFNGSFDRGTPRIINKTLFNQISATDYRRDLFLDKMPNTTVAWDWEKKDSDPNNDFDPNYPTKEEFDAAVKAVNTKYFGGSASFKKHPYQVAKFLNENAATIEPEDVLYMRASEMYLIEAEALAKQGGKDSEAADVLFELISARDAGYTKSTNTGQALVDEILLQRRIELFGEGHRWFDMLRNDEALDLTGSDADPSYYLKGYKQDKPSVNDNWLFQIPQSEINANENMVQNPKASL
ncbi:RagB/SusD family nutrient uptake outer membrane protein [Marinifilum fragile]|uniref:RagB/SusD family nutrient uptake outer membrane protein n=1 Tax=Marinifilum fragile TaxID=570161 RepID=UPI0006D0709A|nr:RagB/SusD family nutrient uptake outer membrane protein [Marinifilum fragile]